MDEEMPRLKDTEWRVLCVIVRQTLGWQSGRGRKRRDWMSQKQLMARTGRNSAALSEAVDALTRRNLIECSDGEGKRLSTPANRRQHRGRVYFALSPSLWKQAEPQAVSTSAESQTPLPALKSQPESTGSIAPQRIYAGWTRAAVVAERQNYPTKTEVQKAKWTK